MPLVGTTPKELKAGSQRHICTPMLTAALFPIAKRWKQPQCPLGDERIKMWSIHTMEYYSASKRKDVLTPAPAWMSLEGVMLSEMSHTRRDKYCRSPLIGGT